MLRAPEPVRLTVAGRTDAGVHARGQVAHVDPDPTAWAALPGRSERAPHEAAASRLRGILPPDIAVRSVSVAPAGFDARFSALRRRYLYRLCDEPASADPLRRRDTVLAKRPLDVDAMHAAAQQLVGLNDFAAFCKRREGATTVRTLLDYSWRRAARRRPGGDRGGRRLLPLHGPLARGRRRARRGASARPGVARRRCCAAGVRDAAVTVMPPHGLSLEEVVYPPDAELAARAHEARAVRTLEG